MIATSVSVIKSISWRDLLKEFNSMIFFKKKTYVILTYNKLGQRKWHFLKMSRTKSQLVIIWYTNSTIGSNSHSEKKKLKPRNIS